MKKIIFIFLFVICESFIFGEDEQEELGFLLFQPNNSNSFVNEYQAKGQLDNLAKNLNDKNLKSGQIHIHGYAAFVQNDIDPIKLSNDRAVFIIEELKKRGIPNDLFSDPIAHGSVNLWGNNLNENDRLNNRRVRILLENDIPVNIAEEKIETIQEQKTENTVLNEKNKSLSFKIPWRILIIILIIILIVCSVAALIKSGVFLKLPMLSFKGNGVRSMPGQMSYKGNSTKNASINDETKNSLRNAGFPEEVIKQVMRQVGSKSPIEGKNGRWTGEKGESTFIFNEDIAKNIADPNIEYLRGGYKKSLNDEDPGIRALAEIVDKMSPEERNELIQNFQDLRDGKAGLDYANGGVITNMDKYAYVKTDVSETLGKKTFATERYSRDDKYGRLGSLEEHKLCMAIKYGKLSPSDCVRAKELSQHIDQNPPDKCAAEIRELKKIYDKCPNFYMDGITGHEHVDLRTVFAVPSGNLHSGGGGGDSSGKAPHIGGHEYLKRAEELSGNA